MQPTTQLAQLLVDLVEKPIPYCVAQFRSLCLNLLDFKLVHVDNECRLWVRQATVHWRELWMSGLYKVSCGAPTSGPSVQPITEQGGQCTVEQVGWILHQYCVC